MITFNSVVSVWFSAVMVVRLLAVEDESVTFSTVSVLLTTVGEVMILLLSVTFETVGSVGLATVTVVLLCIVGGMSVTFANNDTVWFATGIVVLVWLLAVGDELVAFASVW